MGRGIDGVKIFRNKADGEDFLERGIESAFEIYEKGVGKARRGFTQAAVKKMGYSGA